MRLAVRVAIVAVCSSLASVSAAEDACDGIPCSGHGECMIERDDAFCLCEDGYAAEGIDCVEVPEAQPSDVARRSTSMGSRIVYIASLQGGLRGPQVGRSWHGQPGQLNQYMRVGELWCSDFVSWVYAAAGAPFSGGYQGGWMLTNNYAIREWFRRQDRWVDSHSNGWAEFEPRPGDYLRFDTARYGHSAIVRYVAGDVLYTVEGNGRGGVVRLRRYPDWRSNRRIDGFGIVTNAAPRVVRLARALTARRTRATRSP